MGKRRRHATRQLPSWRVAMQHMEPLKARLHEALQVVWVWLALFSGLALVSYHADDPSWSHVHTTGIIHNRAGVWGAYSADWCLYFLGVVAYMVPCVFLYMAVRGVWQSAATDKIPYQNVLQGLGWLFALQGLCTLCAMGWPSRWIDAWPVGPGGVLGVVWMTAMIRAMGQAGAVLCAGAWFLVGITLGTGLSWWAVAQRCGYECVRCASWLRRAVRDRLPSWPRSKRKPRFTRPSWAAPVEAWSAVPDEHPLTQPAPSKKRRLPTSAAPSGSVTDDRVSLPALNLLAQGPGTEGMVLAPEQRDHWAQLVEQRLADFGVSAQVVGVAPGPVITRFELSLAPGVKAAKISGLARDLARALSVVSVRVVEVIPGKPVVGLEVPNIKRCTVYLQEMLASAAYTQATSPLTLALGKDIAGEPVVVDLARMPHLLVAGTTGSGKSVGVNAMLMSLLYKSQPEDARLILIDPKMLELSVYEGIPHLLAPVVTDMKDAALALQWCVAEMEARYRLMATLGVRNKQGLDQAIREAKAAGQPIMDPFFKDESGQTTRELAPLPYIVVVIDEFADMIMVVGKKVEDLIARIAQKARAAGMHLILATQRPSVDVITGLIKANIPTRIAFQVSSRIDSRTILDQQGAEQLLGHGDMLYLPPGTGVPMRVHGAFVSDQEVHAVVKDWQQRGAPQYESGITSPGDNTEGRDPGSWRMDWADPEQDPLYDEAVAWVLEHRRASVSAIQRQFRIGYNRAARLVEQMETAGLVSAMQGNGTRDVLVPERV